MWAQWQRAVSEDSKIFPSNCSLPLLILVLATAQTILYFQLLVLICICGIMEKIMFSDIYLRLVTVV